MSVPAATLNAKPASIPIAVRRKLSAITAATSCRDDAPSAIRSPNSRVRRRPSNATTAYCPMAAMISEPDANSAEQRRENPDRRGLCGNLVLERSQAGDRDPAVGLAKDAGDRRSERVDSAAVADVERGLAGRRRTIDLPGRRRSAADPQPPRPLKYAFSTTPTISTRAAGPPRPT